MVFSTMFSLGIEQSTQAGFGTVQAALDGTGGNAHHPGSFPASELVIEDQLEGLALCLWQALEGGAQVITSLNTLHHALWTGSRVGQVSCDGAVFRVSTPAGVDGFKAGDREHPGAYAALSSKAPCALPHSQHDILQNLLSQLSVPQAADEISQNSRPLTGIKVFERTCISAGDGPHQGQVGIVNRAGYKL